MRDILTTLRFWAEKGYGRFAGAVIDKIARRSDVIHIEGDESMRKRIG
ncbi:hypothetical protein [Adlercreutzia muris]